MVRRRNHEARDLGKEAGSNKVVVVYLLSRINQKATAAGSPLQQPPGEQPTFLRSPPGGKSPTFVSPKHHHPITSQIIQTIAARASWGPYKKV